MFIRSAAIRSNVLAAAAVSLLVAAVPAQAQSPADIVKTREAAMKKLGGSMQTLTKFIKNEGATTADVQSAAAAVAEVAAADITPLFPKGTEAGMVEGSEAKPEVWAKWDEFQKSWMDLTPAAARLSAAASSGDRAQIARATQDVGKVCSSCHETFRVPKT